jgi:hypothetical protein
MRPADGVIAALEEQVGCYRRLAELADLQQQCVGQGRTEELLAILRIRDAEVERLTKVGHVVGPAKRRWRDYAAGLDAATRARAEGLLAEARRLLERITAADRADVLAIQRQKLNAGRPASRWPEAHPTSRHHATAAYARRVK